MLYGRFDPFLGLLKRLHDDTWDLDYTPPERLEDIDILIRFGQMKERWSLADALAQEVPGLIRPRSRDELDRLRSLVEHLEEKMNAVVNGRPLSQTTRRE